MHNTSLAWNEKMSPMGVEWERHGQEEKQNEDHGCINFKMSPKLIF